MEMTNLIDAQPAEHSYKFNQMQGSSGIYSNVYTHLDLCVAVLRTCVTLEWRGGTKQCGIVLVSGMTDQRLPGI